MRTLYRHGRIYSPSSPYATAMVIEDGVLTWLGQGDGTAQFEDAEHVADVDLHDAFVAPAFVDPCLPAGAPELGLVPTGAAALDVADNEGQAERIAQRGDVAVVRPGSDELDLHSLAGLGVPLAFTGTGSSVAVDPWLVLRAAAYPPRPEKAISPRAAFAAHTRGGWRALGMDSEGILNPGSTATFAIWRAGETAVDAPEERVQRWSTDPRANVPGLPDVAPGAELPLCLMTVLRGAVLYSAGQLRTG